MRVHAIDLLCPFLPVPIVDLGRLTIGDKWAQAYLHQSCCSLPPVLTVASRATGDIWQVLEPLEKPASFLVPMPPEGYRRVNF